MAQGVVTPNMLRIEVPGEPVPLARARVTGRGTYLPARSREYRQRVQTAWLVAGRPRLAGWVQVAVLAVFERPLSYRRADGSANPRCPDFPPKGDVDNVLKAVLDALGDLAFEDDKMVVSASATKIWGAPARTVITVRRQSP